MAQRTIHYLFGELLSRQVPLKDKKRFLLGSILPDSYVDIKDRKRIHFEIIEGKKKYLAFHSFLEKYYEQIQKDDLYLGYYMHLVEDAFYRSFFYLGNYKMPPTMEEVARLHQDYHILNKYIVEKYNLENILYEREGFSIGLLDEIAEFCVDSFLDELSEDFIEDVSGQTYYITENMVDSFVEMYFPKTLLELQSVQKGKSILTETDYTWEKIRK